MRNIGRKIGKITAVAGVAGIITAGTYLTCFGLNHLLNRWEDTNEFYHSVTRPDGAFGHTRYTRFHNGAEAVHQLRFYNTEIGIADGGPCGKKDGLVDAICISEGIKTTTFNRDEDYDKHKEEFDKADKLLAETKERFKEYFE